MQNILLSIFQIPKLEDQSQARKQWSPNPQLLAKVRNQLNTHTRNKLGRPFVNQVHPDLIPEVYFIEIAILRQENQFFLLEILPKIEN
jgi:hypothetical protein